MKETVRKFLDGAISRRVFVNGLIVAGVGAPMARTLAERLSDPAPAVNRPGRTMMGTGGALWVAQIKAAGMTHLFASPASGHTTIYDALVDEPNIQLVTAPHEGAVAAMADGFARASGRTPMVLISHLGLPNAMTQMYNAWKDNIPLVVSVDHVGHSAAGQDDFQEVVNIEGMASPVAKWTWTAELTDKIPDVVRRAIKFAATAPCSPVFLSFPANVLHGQGRAAIVDQALASVSNRIRPDAAQIEAAAERLVHAKSPLIYVGDDITWSGAEPELLELVELLSLPVCRGDAQLNLGWSMPFPNRHPLFLGEYQRGMRHPSSMDLLVNLGGRLPYAMFGREDKLDPRLPLIELRSDPDALARVYPAELAILTDLKAGLTDLLAAVRERAPARLQKHWRETRYRETAAYTAQSREYFQALVKQEWDVSPMTVERVMGELDAVLDPDACIVSEVDSGFVALMRQVSLGGQGRKFFSNSGLALGWALPAALGVKIALPDRPVVAVLGDGAFLFSGPQPLWSYSRYRAPISVIVLNNRSYNRQRSTMLSNGGRQFQAARDMACYLGDPDVDFVKLSAAFGVEAESVIEPNGLNTALRRAQAANREGRPYLLEVQVGRSGAGALSTWYPPYSIAARRRRAV